MGRGKLTDREKKKIIARYVDTQNYCQVAREFNLSETSVRRVIKGNPAVVERVEHKKEENTLDMIQYMEGQKPKIQKLLANILDAMDDPAKLARTNPRDLATAYGIIWDKIMAGAPKADEEQLQRARDILGNINGVIE